MPMFEYQCNSCGTVNEFLIGVTAEDPQIVCAACGGTSLQKKMSAMSFTIKGGASASASERFPIAGQCACGGEQAAGTCGADGCCCSA